MEKRKFCIRCSKPFFKRQGLSSLQWNNRKYCSNQCSSTKCNLSNIDIVSMYRSGMSSTDISKKTNVSATQILRILKGLDVDIREASINKKLALTKESTRQKMSASATGRSLSESAKNKLRKRIGSKNHNWKGGLSINNGYLVFTNSSANGCHAGRFLHDVIAEWLYETKVEKGLVVHHIDGNKLNNSPENLSVLNSSDHINLHRKQGDLNNEQCK